MVLRRATAALIDGLAALLAALLLSGVPGLFLAHRAMTALGVGDPDGFWRGPIPFILGYTGNLVHVLPLAFILILLPETFAGAGPGKLAMGLLVGRRHRGGRFLMKTAGCWLHLLGLALAWWPLLAAGLLWNVVLLLGEAPLLLGRPTLLDHFSSSNLLRSSNSPAVNLTK
jgi:hypothetical protein